MNKSEISKFVKSTATSLGFDFCGIAKAEPLHEDAVRLENWLNNNMHGSMDYMQNHFDLRTDPTKLFPGAKSVITVLQNYFTSEKQNVNAPVISKYAFGEDYHDVIRERLHHFFFLLKEQIGEINGRGFVDSAPVLERSWANKSGLGWIGKNGNLINKNKGSFFFIATLIVDVEFEYDNPILKDYCGTCTKCIDHCPTEAILPEKVIDGSKCISYFTIELKEALIPENMKGKFENHFFGCDICQDVCPWNRFSKQNSEERFKPLHEVLHFSRKDWEEISEVQFKNIFKNSPIKRAKYTGIKRNLHFINQSNHD